uniref:Uncharacterized protein n=1 Tax=Loa loa TaxID=7209 RepID=A0A1I7VWE3_LOALO
MLNSIIINESSEVYARISSPTVNTISKFPSRKADIRESEQSRAPNRKFNWMSGERKELFREYYDLNYRLPNDTSSLTTQENATMSIKTASVLEFWSSRKFFIVVHITPYSAFSGRSKQRSGHFVDRDPPSDESKCDYLDPLDLNLSKLHDTYIASSNYHHSKQTDWPSNNESIVITYA